ncbi:MAG: hypothetical protein KU28_04385 [Sulfurovum sp. PC08-66]|jgi:hypothetical protein|nr:MAG: hypothetical protein KU28_04385 [Sulfurovum sp. PC08-66]
MIDSYYKFQQHLESEGIMFSFVGPVSHNVVEGVGTVLRNKMELEAVSTNVSLKVFSIFVEQIQNVIRYSADRIPQDDFESDISFGMLVVGEKNKQYFLVGGNRVTCEQKERLNDFLDKLATMSKEELKQFYKERRKAQPDEHSKGAGLGFIEMARKSTEPIKYNFEKIDNESYYFTIETVV